VNARPCGEDPSVLTEYIEEALRRARYELIDDPETPYYGEVPDLPGVWASGDTLEACRRELKETVEGWILLSVKRSLPIPKLGDVGITEVDAEAA
jgi:predicted RNase H-like HicB family nuclease